jgi:hypothetical protein
MSLFSPTSTWWFIQDGHGHYVFASFYGKSNGKVGFQATAYVFPEQGIALLTIYRTLGRDGPIQIHYATADGTAIAGVDYTAVSGTLTWTDQDATRKTITIPLIQTTSTVSPQFTVNLTNIAPFAFTISPATATVTIKRQGHGEIDFVGSAYSVQDLNTSPNTVVVQVQRFNGFKGAGGVSYHTVDGTAVAGLDYTATSGVLSWADGDGSIQNITITILGRAGFQADRNFTVVIDTPTGFLVIGATNVSTVTITDASPSPNPVAGGGIPQELFTDILNDSQEFLLSVGILDDGSLMAFRNNIQFAGILGQKIGSVIGFNGGTSNFGGGTDPINNDPSPSPTPANRASVRRMGYKERV